MSYRLVLGSASPRRSELLRQIGLEFIVDPSAIEEDLGLYKTPEDAVKALARAKAADVASRHPFSLVLGADTVVAVDGEILGKPSDRDEAIYMLGSLSGRTHEVITGVSLIGTDSRRELYEAVSTRVAFRAMSREEIVRYVDTGEPMDKAGAYGIQGLGSVFVESVSGCYFNIVGLPLFTVAKMLDTFGFAVPLSWH